MAPLIKICGTKKYNDVKAAEESGAFWYGLVFHKKSPRYINLYHAEKIIKKFNKSIFPVAVTVNPDEGFIKNLVDIGIKNIQLHGCETLDNCLFLKDKFNIKVFKGIGLETEKDIELASEYSKIVDWIVFDKKDTVMYGGTGKSFNWNILNKVDININYIISGGLTYKNVLNAINITKAKGVDVSSGVEITPGNKSQDLIEKFCNSVKLFQGEEIC
ncbi:phosphoribosylanthranilate isomerase [Alphaproteobacteria bacterium]|nr:phosphoribosylanthranilate isomerase [Alphaproteobacteria bacterium]